MKQTNKKIKKMRKFAYLFLSLLILFTANVQAQDEEEAKDEVNDIDALIG